MIEEAYFVLSNDAVFDKKQEDFLKEANRIIEQNTKEKRKKDGRLTAFLLGLIFAFLVAGIVFFLTR